MKSFDISRSASIVITVAMTLLMTCNRKTEETSPQTTSAFPATDIVDLDRIATVFKDSSKAYIRTRFTNVNRSFFDYEKDLSRDSIVTLQLFADVSVKLVIESIAPGKNNTEVWTLRPDGPLFGTATIITSPSSIYASIQIDATVYEVFPVGENVVRIREMDQTRFPNEAPPVENISGKGPAAESEGPDAEDPVINVLVVVPTVLTAFCTEPLKPIMEAAYTQNLNMVFNSMEATGITATVTFDCINYAPGSFNMENDLKWVTGNAEVATLRDKHSADLVCLLFPDIDDGLCGKGTINYPVSSASAKTAFSVVKVSCALSTYALAHELGHNMGMKHNRLVLNDFNSPDCNFGSIFKIRSKSEEKTIRSIMAYPDGCDNCPIYPVYSNPMVKTFGDIVIGPMGVACDVPEFEGRFFRANNRQQLIDAAPIVSKFK